MYAYFPTDMSMISKNRLCGYANICKYDMICGSKPRFIISIFLGQTLTMPHLVWQRFQFILSLIRGWRISCFLSHIPRSKTHTAIRIKGTPGNLYNSIGNLLGMSNIQHYHVTNMDNFWEFPVAERYGIVQTWGIPYFNAQNDANPSRSELPCSQRNPSWAFAKSHGFGPMMNDKRVSKGFDPCLFEYISQNGPPRCSGWTSFPH